MTNSHMLGDSLDPLWNKMKRRKERQERSLVPKPPNRDIPTRYVVVLQDDEHRVDLCVCGCLFLFSFLLFLVLTAFTPPPPLQEPQKNVFQMNTGKDVSPHDGLLTPIQLLIIKFYSSQTKAILPNPKYPGKCKIRTLWEKRLKELNIYVCSLAKWWLGWGEVQRGAVISTGTHGAEGWGIFIHRDKVELRVSTWLKFKRRRCRTNITIIALTDGGCASIRVASQRGSIRCSNAWDISCRFILNTGWQYYTEMEKKPSWSPRGGASFLKTLISVSINLSFGTSKLYSIKYNLLTGIFNPCRLALNHELGDPCGCPRRLPWGPDWGRGRPCDPARVVLHTRCPGGHHLALLPSGCGWWRPACPLTVDQHHRPQQAPGNTELWEETAKDTLKANSLTPPCNVWGWGVGRKTNNPCGHYILGREHPLSWLAQEGRSWVSQTVPISRTPGVHLIALKAGSLSIPVIYLFGRREQGQSQMQLINTLFCSIQLASVKC